MVNNTRGHFLSTVKTIAERPCEDVAGLEITDNMVSEAGGQWVVPNRIKRSAEEMANEWLHGEKTHIDQVRQSEVGVQQVSENERGLSCTYTDLIPE